MVSEALKKALLYENEKSTEIKQEERPVYHLSPKVGWMNDPNGLSYYEGEYHLFYQYHPYTTLWGPMHWGHATTKDFIRWNYHPVVLAPDQIYDNYGCFSGSAVTMKDGRHALIYTGCEEHVYENGKSEVIQQQCLAIGDGIHYKKYEGNPVIRTEQIPEGGSIFDFRDPKVWWDEEDKCFYMVVSNRSADGSGEVLLYQSSDLKEWDFVTHLIGGKNQYGKMWECPDFFPVDNTYVLFASPQEMKAKGMEFHNGNGNIYFTGSYDKKTHTYDYSDARAIDYGLEFYAPQTILTEDGRRVMIGWMELWERGFYHPDYMKWFGMMTIARELHIKNGRLIQNPVKELEQYRSNPVHYKDVDINGKTNLSYVEGRTVDLELTIHSSGKDVYESFSIYFAEKEGDYTEVRYNTEDSVLTYDRTYDGYPQDILSIRKVLVRNQNGLLKLRILLDRFSAEIFVNDGEQAITSVVYTPIEARGISFACKGNACIDVNKYDIVLPV